MQLSQIQDEVIDTAHSEGQVDPAIFARLLHHDLSDVQAAISDLVDRGLMAAAGGDAFRLTGQGEAVHRTREEAHRATVVRRSRTWQRG